MERYKLRILPIAQEDLHDIVDYVNFLSPQAALNLYDEIIGGIESLAQMPLRCPLLKTPELRAKGYRALQVKNYLVFFVVIKNIVQIRRILYAKRHFESLL
ncbi:MAG: type II toxin-antitoxin system RelE/ParE family toxin [Firmicutes bacterium]|nr:type II toxin-antitoxin system RelE/ParE family toxin [Bacillota bacterium]